MVESQPYVGQHDLHRRNGERAPCHSPHHTGNTAPAGHHDHAAMVADFRRRFWISLILTVPILALSPMIQGFFGLERALAFPGDKVVLWALSSVVFFYG